MFQPNLAVSSFFLVGRSENLNMIISIMIIMIIKFVNREKELKALKERLKSDNFEFVVIYGRRRIGKTRLILESIKDEEHVYYLAIEGDNLKHFKRVASQVINELNYAEESWESYFNFLKDKIVVIDEFPNLIKENPKVVSEFQRIVDLLLKDTKTKFFILGSSVSIINNKILSYKSPLYGRKTGVLKLKPMNFFDIQGFFPSSSLEELIEIYGFADGIPYYLEKIVPPFWKWLENELERADSFLRYEVDFLMKYEFEDVTTYKKILEAVAFGKTSLKEIRDYLEIRHSDITPYLSNLIETEFLERVVPVTESHKSKRGRYVIQDNFIRFWFRFIFPNLSLIEENSFDVREIKREYSQYLGCVFERVCKEMLINLNKKGRLPFKFTKIGGWWHKAKEIDLIALNELTKEILFAECKWKDNVNAERIAKDMVRNKIPYVRWYSDKRREYIAIFAKSFRKKLEEFDGRKIYCFDLKDMQKLADLFK